MWFQRDGTHMLWQETTWDFQCFLFTMWIGYTPYRKTQTRGHWAPPVRKSKYLDSFVFLDPFCYNIMFCASGFKIDSVKTDCSVPCVLEMFCLKPMFHRYGQYFGNRSAKVGTLSTFGKLFCLTRCSVNVWRVVLQTHLVLITFMKSCSELNRYLYKVWNVLLLNKCSYNDGYFYYVLGTHSKTHSARRVIWTADSARRRGSKDVYGRGGGTVVFLLFRDR